MQACGLYDSIKFSISIMQMSLIGAALSVYACYTSIFTVKSTKSEHNFLAVTTHSCTYGRQSISVPYLFHIVRIISVDTRTNKYAKKIPSSGYTNATNFLEGGSLKLWEIFETYGYCKHHILISLLIKSLNICLRVNKLLVAIRPLFDRMMARDLVRPYSSASLYQAVPSLFVKMLLKL